MTEKELEQQIERAINRVHRAYIALIPAVLLIFFLTPVPWWSLPLLFLGNVVVLNLYANYQMRRLATAVVRDGISTENTTVEVLNTSNEIVGRYLDHDVPEWVDVRVDGKVRRFIFSSFAPTMGDALQLPADAGHLLFRAAHFQPEQAAS